MEIEPEMLAMETIVPVYFAVEDDALLSIYEQTQAASTSQGSASAAEGELGAGGVRRGAPLCSFQDPLSRAGGCCGELGSRELCCLTGPGAMGESELAKVVKELSQKDPIAGVGKGSWWEWARQAGLSTQWSHPVDSPSSLGKQCLSCKGRVIPPGQIISCVDARLRGGRLWPSAACLCK